MMLCTVTGDVVYMGTCSFIPRCLMKSTLPNTQTSSRLSATGISDFALQLRGAAPVIRAAYGSSKDGMWCSATALPLLPREGKLLRVPLGALRSACASAALGVVPIKAFLVCGEPQVPANQEVEASLPFLSL